MARPPPALTCVPARRVAVTCLRACLRKCACRLLLCALFAPHLTPIFLYFGSLLFAQLGWSFLTSNAVWNIGLVRTKFVVDFGTDVITYDVQQAVRGICCGVYVGVSC